MCLYIINCEYFLFLENITRIKRFEFDFLFIKINHIQVHILYIRNIWYIGCPRTCRLFAIPTRLLTIISDKTSDRKTTSTISINKLFDVLVFYNTLYIGENAHEQIGTFMNDISRIPSLRNLLVIFVTNDICAKLLDRSYAYVIYMVEQCGRTLVTLMCELILTDDFLRCQSYVPFVIGQLNLSPHTYISLTYIECF